MATWILRMDAPGTGPRVGIKDLIDLEGTPTTAACVALAARATPAEQDAACLAGLRAVDAAIVGKTNLHELACGGTGVNAAFGTPVNPFDAACIPGGSSSGNAVALANHEVDVAIGTDTAGSIRTPSACCGTVGLKTTSGRVPTAGVWPLAPSLDSIGPMARDVAGVVRGMALLEPGFMVGVPAGGIGRVRLADVDPAIDGAIDAVLATAEIDVVDIVLPGWDTAAQAGWGVMFHELWQVDGFLYDEDRDHLGTDIRERLEHGRDVSRQSYQGAGVQRTEWRAELAAAFRRTPVLAWPTIAMFPPRLDDPVPDTRRTNLVVNHAGHPSLALPAPTSGRFPASLQLVGPDHSEDVLCATGLVLEAAALTI